MTRPSRVPRWISEPAGSFTSTRSPVERALRRCFIALLCSIALAACQPSPAKQPAAIWPSRIDRFEGHILQPNGTRVEYSVILVDDPKQVGAVLGTINIPSQMLRGASLASVRFQRGERIEFELDASGRPHWLGLVEPSGAIRCSFRQGADELPCTMLALR